MGKSKIQEQVGCEVQLCQAAHCDQERKRTCALRREYLSEAAKLRERYAEAQSEITRNIWRKRMERMGIWDANIEKSVTD